MNCECISNHNVLVEFKSDWGRVWCPNG